MLRLAMFAAVALATSLLPTPDADACGSYVPEPQVFALSSHGLTSGGTRTFVVLRAGAPDGRARWRQLAPRTDDPARIAAGGSLERPLQVTVVGPAGTRTVTGERWTYLSQTFEFAGSMTAVEVDPGRGDDRGFKVALPGAHRDAKWIGLTEAERAAGDAAWIAGQGVALGRASEHRVARVEGSALEVLTMLDADGRPTTLLRHGTDSHGHYAGAAIGALAVDGARYLLVQHEGTVRRVHLPLV